MNKVKKRKHSVSKLGFIYYDYGQVERGFSINNNPHVKNVNGDTVMLLMMFKNCPMKMKRIGKGHQYLMK